MQRVIVVGGGLSGVVTAYELVHLGYDTLLLEQREGIALETSYANGSLLTPSMADPWNAPGVYRHLVASLFSRHSAMKLRLSAIPSLAGWGLRFLRHSSVALHDAATKASFALAKYSVERTGELRERLSLRYDATTVGTLKIFRTEAAMEGSLSVAAKLAPLGLRFQVLDRDGVVADEPALADIRDQITGALRFPDDESGDAHQFCNQMATAFVRAGGVIKTNTRVGDIALERGSVSGVLIGNRVERADIVVVAAGNASVQLVKPLGLSLPIRPAKGYTITFDTSSIQFRPVIPIIDDALHAAIVPIGDRLRVAGTAEFAGNNQRIRKDRVENLLGLLATVLPRVAEKLSYETAQPWAGLRPMSADGLPFIGPTHLRGLYVNTGHGHLGWTLAAGSACLLGGLVGGAVPDIDPTPYRATR